MAILNQFALHHILQGKPLPKDLDHRSSANTSLYEASIKNEHFQGTSKIARNRNSVAVTGGYNGTEKYGNTKAINPNASCLILGNFCPPGMKAEEKERGVLSTFETAEDDNGELREVCHNSLPTNESVYTVFHDIAKVISNRYDLGLQDAISCSIELCAWVDILNIVKPRDAADPDSDNSDYWATRNENDELNMKYIQDLLNGPLQNVEIIIAVGDHAFDFVEKMIDKKMIDLDKVKFLQHSPNIHPTKKFKYGITLKQRHWYYQSITDMLTHILRQSRVNVKKEEVMTLCEHRSNSNNDTHGNFVYYGEFRGKRILIGRGHAHFKKLLVDAYVSAGDFPTQGTFLETEERCGNVDGLDVKLIWYTKHNNELMKFDYRGLKFGYQHPLDSEIMEEWKKVAKEKQHARLLENAEMKRPAERIEAAAAIRGAMPGFLDHLDGMKTKCAKTGEP